ncbi:hypothetical protein [Candidatus Wolbachia massiliensis]|uniref:Uncharacterized protein n=1 Tax=Candidatus Wolbachia massiliensis TaxID=1845000 RepID=A0A7L7YLH8_9RICK|nr:hypothetical protein [Candidatus Wolbachia massiliensis]QOD37918.1 hypothetical protein ID128_03600 [Candidatus Wolbachia massiliensis]
MSEIDFINFNHHSNLEQEFGNGYIRLIDSSFDKDTGHYQVESKILDKSYNMVGNLTIDGYIHNSYKDDHNMYLKFSTEIDLKGDMEKILSLGKGL